MSTRHLLTPFYDPLLMTDVGQEAIRRKGHGSISSPVVICAGWRRGTNKLFLRYSLKKPSVWEERRVWAVIVCSRMSGAGMNGLKQLDIGTISSIIAHREQNIQLQDFTQKYYTHAVCTALMRKIKDIIQPFTFVQILHSPTQLQWWNEIQTHITDVPSLTTGAATLFHIFQCLAVTCHAFRWHLRKLKTFLSVGYWWNRYFRAQWRLTFFHIILHHVHLKCINILTDLRSLLCVYISNMTFLETCRLLWFKCHWCKWIKLINSLHFYPYWFSYQGLCVLLESWCWVNVHLVLWLFSGIRLIIIRLMHLGSCFEQWLWNDVFTL